MNIDNRIKELIAVGASVTANCQPCLQYHVAKAAECGADQQQIAEALDIGKMVRKGAAAKMDTLAANLNNAIPSAASAKGDGCGCSS